MIHYHWHILGSNLVLEFVYSRDLDTLAQMHRNTAPCKPGSKRRTGYFQCQGCCNKSFLRGNDFRIVSLLPPLSSQSLVPELEAKSATRQQPRRDGSRRRNPYTSRQQLRWWYGARSYPRLQL